MLLLQNKYNFSFDLEIKWHRATLCDSGRVQSGGKTTYEHFCLFLFSQPSINGGRIIPDSQCFYLGSCMVGISHSRHALSCETWQSGRVANQTRNTLTKSNIGQLPWTELAEQERCISCAGLNMSAGQALSLGAIYSGVTGWPVRRGGGVRVEASAFITLQTCSFH